MTWHTPGYEPTKKNAACVRLAAPVPLLYGGTGMMSNARGYILVLEDDNAVRETLVHLLNFAIDADIIPVSDADEALNAIERHGLPRVALLDYLLVRGTCDGVAAMLERQGVPVIVMTALPTAKPLHAQQILHKPFDIDEMLTALAKAGRVTVRDTAKFG